MSPKDTEWGLVTGRVRDHLFIAGEPRSLLVQFGFAPEFVSRIPLDYVSSDNAVALVEAVRNDGIDTQLHVLETLVRLDKTVLVVDGEPEADRAAQQPRLRRGRPGRATWARS
ncbi:hypothetical protein [Streptomyces sp. NBC_01408]|uniref:hypothetical protein n=1 Tax=Streptomyces sp. NBC_01408 TaxID=2903855 RepID=UPI002250D203|nr:hypothetical protein [Streptomyces sp. NBC_01408]MCX4695497.1 hypothetical protein [Streptomyces sp. NBC_01408]